MYILTGTQPARAIPYRGDSGDWCNKTLLYCLSIDHSTLSSLLLSFFPLSAFVHNVWRLSVDDTVSREGWNVLYILYCNMYSNCDKFSVSNNKKMNQIGSEQNLWSHLKGRQSNDSVTRFFPPSPFLTILTKIWTLYSYSRLWFRFRGDNRMCSKQVFFNLKRQFHELFLPLFSWFKPDLDPMPELKHFVLRMKVMEGPWSWSISRVK